MKYQEIPMYLYIELLDDRYNFVRDKFGWGDSATDSLWPDLMEYIEQVGVPADNADPKYIVDNYCVNGEFISREDFEENLDWYSSYEDWDEVRENALISNDEYACMRF